LDVEMTLTDQKGFDGAIRKKLWPFRRKGFIKYWI